MTACNCQLRSRLFAGTLTSKTNIMSQLLIQQYLNQLSTLKKVSGSTRESVVREAFKDLLKGWARSHDLVFVPEYEIETKTKERRYVDGALLYELRVPFGYWEAKDEKDDLEAEIEYKFKRGYPQDNIIFEDSKLAILIQNKQEVIRCFVDDTKGLEKLLDLFFRHERTEISEFRQAVEQFKADLPAVLKALREMIEREHTANAKFRAAEKKFLAHAQEAINPSLTDADVREMLIQHVLTEEIFSKVFGEDDFHRQNNVAKELYALEGTFFTGDLKKRTLRGLDAYYAAIRSAAAQIGSHHEKQAFLKVIYENFYKVYNKKAADRLGVVYTPNEIVRFMIESADWLCEKHFGRNLIDKDVEILDPATGTGTFICELLEHFRGQPAKLKYKYSKELHANEVAILPYYVANLNIEATYAAITGEYAEFENLCFVDTLDNTEGLRKHAGHVDDMFGSMSVENVARIRRQNIKRISVIIGNPPYNANQLNENENNKNREYPEIDKRIKNTYIAASTAQKTKLYDMYARFFRWASDRLDVNGVLAFISNRSFIDMRTFDGFRETVGKEFNEIHIVDLGGDVRANPKLSGTKHNVFGIQTGVAISFLVRRHKAKGCRIFYARRPELETADEKLAFLQSAKASALRFEEIKPDARHNWINQANNDFDTLLPLASKAAKATDKASAEKTIFKLFSLGISTNRDEWIYGDDPVSLEQKMRYLVTGYGAQKSKSEFDTAIKWSRNLKRRFAQGRKEPFDSARIVAAAYRPFHKAYLYDSGLFIDEGGAKDEIFPLGKQNLAICFSDAGSRTNYCVLAVSGLADLHFGAAVDAYQQVPLYRYDGATKADNITDWAFDQFRKHYQPGRSKKERPATKEAIFHYIYGVLYDPVYREKYALNLKREFPRIPFYADFWQWADWGKALMEMHVGYEGVAPAKLKRTDTPDEKARKAGLALKAMLKADKDGGRIVLDSETTLAGIPPEAWEYRLGNRSALEWVLDQYKETKPKDPTIREKFDTYRFADYKEKVIDLLARVTTVSVETQRIVEAMKGAGASPRRPVARKFLLA
jgi:predicted helicase